MRGRALRRGGKFGFLHVVSFAEALDLVDRGLVRCGLSRRQLEALAAKGEFAVDTARD
jgi:hypothetical protein